MKSVLLIGLGRFGKNVAEKLNELGHEVMAIDKVEKRVNAVLPIVTDAQIGDSTNEAFLKTLGVDNYDVCIVTIGDDFQSSLETTSLLKDLGAKRVVSRASDDIHEKFLLKNGADNVVYPEKQLASFVAIKYTTNHILDFIALDSEYAVYEISVPEEWYQKSVGELDVRKKYNLNILALRDENKQSIIVNSETVFSPSQTVLVLGKWKDIKKCFKD
ncbi:MAG: TrkA family potassium uptake protein [Clostridia bacterium]|nr:TrkA family potassium uptake protein [Clostridia bacterium]